MLHARLELALPKETGFKSVAAAITPVEHYFGGENQDRTETRVHLVDLFSKQSPVQQGLLSIYSGGFVKSRTSTDVLGRCFVFQTKVATTAI